MRNRSSLGWPGISLILSIISLAGCEAELNLEGVEAERAKSIVRTDQFQEMVVSEDTLILLGSQGLVMTSKDKGQNWQRNVIEGKPNFIGAATCPDKSVIALSFDHRIWSSQDQGNSWNDLPISTREDVMAITCAPDNSYWVSASFSTLLTSVDQGKNWQQSSLDEDALITHIEFFDEKNGVLAGEFGIFYKTSDGGNSWSSAGIIGEELYPLAVYFSDPLNGWAGGLSGVIMTTSDGGTNWTQQKTASASPVYGFIPNGDQLYSIGDHSSVQVLNNSQWDIVESPKIPVYLSTGISIDPQTLLVAGGWGTLYPLSTTTSNNQ